MAFLIQIVESAGILNFHSDNKFLKYNHQEMDDLSNHMEDMHVIEPLQHLITYNDSQKSNPLWKEVIPHLEKIMQSFDKNFYVSVDNAPVIWDIIRFSVEALVIGDIRKCQIILGLKGCGKTELVKQIRKAIELNIEGVKLFFFDAHCEEQLNLDVIDQLFSKPNQKILLIIDEAQNIYPSIQRLENHAEEKKTWREYTNKAVRLLHRLANTPYCLCLLTGSSQALRTLYRGKKHEDYEGVYADLNDRKYTIRTLLSLRNAKSVMEFFSSRKKTVISAEIAQGLLNKFGGCPNQLLNMTDADINWDKSTWMIVHTLKTIPSFIDNGITTKDLNDIIKSNSDIMNDDEKIIAIRYKLVDNGILEEHSGTYFIACKRYIMEYDLLHQQFSPENLHPTATQKYHEARSALISDNIPLFMQLTREAMRNIPAPVFGRANIRKYESLAQSILHVLLYFSHPFGSNYTTEATDQGSRLDLYYENKYRHYIELKGPEHKETAPEALEQVRTKKYFDIYPRSEALRKKPKILYGVKWSLTSDSIDIVLSADPEIEEDADYFSCLKEYRTKATTAPKPNKAMTTAPVKKTNKAIPTKLTRSASLMKQSSESKPF